MTSPGKLAATKRGSVVAAAGCGKTELIARAVKEAGGRQLVLTHTNAGVEALRRRMRRLGVPSERVAVDTIAGWSLKYVASYPGRSGGMPTTDDGFVDWNPIYPTMARLLSDAVIRKVVLASYKGAFIDEYQDCDEPQHALITKLSDLLPMRILGDPLQAVFSFRGEPPDWSSCVESTFPRVGTLTTPWRWKRVGESAPLGEWLAEARQTLEAGKPLDLTDQRIRLVRTADFEDWSAKVQEVAFELAELEGTVVGIHKWPGGGFQLLSRLTGGRYQCVEAIHAKDAAQMLDILESSQPRKRPRALIDFIKLVATHYKDPLSAMRKLATREIAPEIAEPSVVRAYALLNELAEGAGPNVAAAALDALAQAEGVRVYRRELLRAALDSLRDAAASGYEDLKGFLLRRRNLSSHVGRRPARCNAGSTLLVKGMEFDHALVIDTGQFSLNDLYVAITRGSKSLTILSPQTMIDPGSLSQR